MVVGVRQWLKNFRLLGTIKHGMLFNALLMLKPLVVNGFIQLSFVLMVLSIAIRHGWLSLVINKSMGLTMRRLLLRLPK